MIILEKSSRPTADVYTRLFPEKNPEGTFITIHPHRSAIYAPVSRVMWHKGLTRWILGDVQPVGIKMLVKPAEDMFRIEDLRDPGHGFHDIAHFKTPWTAFVPHAAHAAIAARYDGENHRGVVQINNSDIPITLHVNPGYRITIAMQSGEIVQVESPFPDRGPHKQTTIEFFGVQDDILLSPDQPSWSHPAMTFSLPQYQT